MLFCQANICVKQIQKNPTSLTETAECPKNTSTYNQKSQSSSKVKINKDVCRKYYPWFANRLRLPWNLCDFTMTKAKKTCQTKQKPTFTIIKFNKDSLKKSITV